MDCQLQRNTIFQLVGGAFFGGYIVGVLLSQVSEVAAIGVSSALFLPVGLFIYFKYYRPYRRAKRLKK